MTYTATVGVTLPSTNRGEWQSWKSLEALDMPYLVSEPTYPLYIDIFVLSYAVPRHGVRCLEHTQDHLYAAIQNGDLNRLVTLLRKNPSMIEADEEASYAKTYILFE